MSRGDDKKIKQTKGSQTAEKEKKMTIKEAKENGMYADVDISEIENVNGVMDMSVDAFPSVEMNGCEFYLYLQKDPATWKNYEDYSEEQKENIRKEAWDMYEYTEKDKFMVIFLKNRGGE